LAIEGHAQEMAEAEKKIDKLRTKISDLYTELDRFKEMGTDLPSTRKMEMITEVEYREVPDGNLV